MTENQILVALDETATEVEMGWDLYLNNREDTGRMLERGDVTSEPSSNKKTNDEGGDDIERSTAAASSQSKHSMFQNAKENLFGAMHRQITDEQQPDNQPNNDQEEDDDDDDDDDDESSPEVKPPSTTNIAKEQQEQELKNVTKTKDNISNKKPLANLALPITSKHVSEKMLTETLMLQQDNKLMKAVQNQTNHTFTEAQADAAVSSKAVADAADMVSNVLNDPDSVEARTCCTSILNVFHENCNVDEEEELSDRRLFVGVAVIAFCGLVKSLIRHFHIRWLPEAAGCIMVGGM